MSWLEGLRAGREGARGGGVVESVVVASGGSTACQSAFTEAETASPSPALSQPVRLSSSLLYVATDLESWETSTPDPNQDEICERCGYRRLDPAYYAWLRSMMVRARQAHHRAQLPDADYELLRTRFNAIQEWALTRFGQETLLAAVRDFAPGQYQPPAPGQPEEPETQVEAAPAHVYPPDGDWRFAEPVSPEAVAKVEAVREQALALGWSEAQLYQNRGRYSFPCGQDYGLVCFLHGDDRVGEITGQFIEIISPRGSRLRFHNHNVEQQWLRRVSQSEEPQGDPDALPRFPVGS